MADQPDTRLIVLRKYIALVRKLKRYPSKGELLAEGVNRDHIHRHFESVDKLKEKARKAAPTAFKDILDVALFDRKHFSRLKNKAGDFQRYFITTAVAGKKVHRGFLRSIRQYCKLKKAMLLVLPCADPASVGGFSLDPILRDEAVVTKDLQLNENFFISSILLSAKHIDPVTSLGRIGQRNGSFVYASPKQRLKMVPTSNSKLPHAMMTTGAITDGIYTTDRYMSERTAYLAEADHVLGGLIVEIQDDKIFHFRQVQADKNGHFIDLGDFYRGNRVERIRPAALVLGDWHSGETSAIASEGFLFGKDSLLAATSPRALVVHDGFNGKSINHHEANNKILRAQLARQAGLDLETELKGYALDLSRMARLPGVDKVVISHSNHDQFLNRYLEDAGHEADPQNYLIGLKLSVAMIEGEANPVKAAVDGWLLPNTARKIRWLSEDEDYKVANIELGAHGHRGASGSRGSVQGMEAAYGISVSGHSHTPEILRGAWQVGTCSHLKLNYSKGPSSWMHSSCLVYPNGARQMINIIGDSWRLQEGKNSAKIAA